MEKLKNNWFQIIVILLLIMIYGKLGGIKENTFYTADIIDSHITRISGEFTDYLSDIKESTQDIAGILYNHF